MFFFHFFVSRLSAMDLNVLGSLSHLLYCNVSILPVVTKDILISARFSCTSSIDGRVRKLISIVQT